ncbi:MAG: ribonuclease HII [Anaerolineales bacterium]|nr:ribonuclease HII [Anaerolineales bacterium]
MSRASRQAPLSADFVASWKHTVPDLQHEQRLWEAGTLLVGGIDEAGRGALAGPVSAAVVILPPDLQIADQLKGVRDSKQMTPHQRSFWAEAIRRLALGWGVGFASAQEIDTAGIVPATRLAAHRAIQMLVQPPQYLLIDFLLLPDCAIPQTALVKGDCRSLSIAAASVLAKTARDQHMIELDQQLPGYGLAVHKGYGTSMHLQALEHLGPSPIHRLSFRRRHL